MGNRLGNCANGCSSLTCSNIPLWGSYNFTIIDPPPPDSLRDYTAKSNFTCKTITVENPQCIVAMAPSLIAWLSTLSLRFQPLFENNLSIENQVYLIEKFREEGKCWTIHITHYSLCDSTNKPCLEIAEKGMDVWLLLNDKYLAHISSQLSKQQSTIHMRLSAQQQKSHKDDDDDDDDNNNGGRDPPVVVSTFVKKSFVKFPSVPEFNPSDNAKPAFLGERARYPNKKEAWIEEE